MYPSLLWLHQPPNYPTAAKFASQSSGDKMERLFAFLREELKRRGSVGDKDSGASDSPPVTARSDNGAVS
jgi:hypothetical protein